MGAEDVALATLVLTTIIALATLIYAGLTYRMVQEMRAARLQAHKPNVVVLPPPASLIILAPHSVGTGFEWIVHPGSFSVLASGSDKEEIRKSRFVSPSIGIKNIGTAPAVNIRVAATVYRDELPALIMSHPFFVAQAAKLNSYSFLEMGGTQYNLAALPPVEIPISVSTPSTDYALEVKLPHTETLRFILNMFFKDWSYSKSALPAFKVLLQYEDLEGRPYRTEFFIEPDLGAASMGTDTGGKYLGIGGNVSLTFASKRNVAVTANS